MMNTTRILITLLLVLIAGLAPGALRGAASSEFALDGQVVLPQEAIASGGEFSLDGEVASRVDPEKAGFALKPSCVSGAAKLGTSTCGCLCGGAIFVDSFESGDLSAWTSSVP